MQGQDLGCIVGRREPRGRRAPATRVASAPGPCTCATARGTGTRRRRHPPPPAPPLLLPCSFLQRACLITNVRRPRLQGRQVVGAHASQTSRHPDRETLPPRQLEHWHCIQAWSHQRARQASSEARILRWSSACSRRRSADRWRATAAKRSKLLSCRRLLRQAARRVRVTARLYRWQRGSSTGMLTDQEHAAASLAVRLGGRAAP